VLLLFNMMTWRDTVQVTENKLENATVELKIEVPVNTVELEYKSVFNEIQKNARIAGFRKGKVPLQIIEQKFIEKADYEVTENLLRSVYVDVITEKKLTPINNPDFDFDKIQRGKPFSFTVRFEIAPTVDLGEYKDLPVEQKRCEIKDKDIDREIESLREQHADISKKEGDTVVDNGDLVKIKIKRIDNMDPSEIEKTAYKDYTIIAGKSNEDYTFDKYIIGMKEGEEKEVEIRYPRKYEVSDLAGQKASYLIRIEEISTMTLPELDDEFAKDLGEHSSLGELRESIRKNLQDYVDNRINHEAKTELLKKVVEKSSFDIPETMVRNEMESSFQRFQQRIGFAARDINEFTSALGVNADEFLATLRTDALESIKSMLVLSEIARQEKLEVDQQRYREVLEGFAKENNKTVEEVENIIEENNSKSGIESELLVQQALNLVYDRAQVKRGKVMSYEEFMKKE